MPIRPIALSEDEPTIDFGDYYDNPSFVSSALQVWASDLKNAVCYCLQFSPGSLKREACFDPYGLRDGLNGLITDHSIYLPSSIPFGQLVCQNGDGHEYWPVLGEWLPGDTSLHPLQLAGSTWHVEARIESNGKFMGYFKAAIPDQSGLRDDEFPVEAYRRTARFVAQTLMELNQNGVINDQGFRNSVRESCLLVRENMKRGNRTKAMQMLASLVTFHKGASFNRVAIFLNSNGTSRCEYAHGGDCSSGFSDSVQAEIAMGFQSIDELMLSLRDSGLPHSDPLFSAVEQGNKPIVTGRGNSVLDLLFQNEGVLESLPREVELLEIFPESFSQSKVKLDFPKPLAVIVHRNDGWLCSNHSERLGGMLRMNLNDTFALVPWNYGGTFIGMILADLGYWAHVDLVRDILPRVNVLQWLLREFSPVFGEME